MGKTHGDESVVIVATGGETSSGSWITVDSQGSSAREVGCTLRDGDGVGAVEGEGRHWLALCRAAWR